MNPRVIHVQSHPDFTLSLIFTNGQHRRFDVKPFLNQGIFRELAQFDYFRQVRGTLGTVSWPHEEDFCPDTLYADSVDEVVDVATVRPQLA